MYYFCNPTKTCRIFHGVLILYMSKVTHFRFYNILVKLLLIFYTSGPNRRWGMQFYGYNLCRKKS